MRSPFNATSSWLRSKKVSDSLELHFLLTLLVDNAAATFRRGGIKISSRLIISMHCGPACPSKPPGAENEARRNTRGMTRVEFPLRCRWGRQFIKTNERRQQECWGGRQGGGGRTRLQLPSIWPDQLLGGPTVRSRRLRASSRMTAASSHTNLTAVLWAECRVHQMFAFHPCGRCHQHAAVSRERTEAKWRTQTPACTGATVKNRTRDPYEHLVRQQPLKSLNSKDQTESNSITGFI